MMKESFGQIIWNRPDQKLASSKAYIVHGTVIEVLKLAMGFLKFKNFRTRLNKKTDAFLC